MDLAFKPLGQEHDRAAFSCGEPTVDRFLKEFAHKRAQLKAAVTIVAARPESLQQIVGFYTLIPHEFRGPELPAVFRKRTGTGNLTAVPGVLLALLGVDVTFQGQGISVALMQHALRRCSILANEFGAVAIVTDPIDERASRIYTSFDFVVLAEGGRRLILPMKTAIRAIERQDRLNALLKAADAALGASMTEWLSNPHPRLGGRKPSECCGSDEDLERALALLM